MKRKFLSSALAVCLVLQMVPVGVWAETQGSVPEEMETVTVTEETEYKEENAEEQQDSGKNTKESDSADVIENKTEEEDTEKEDSDVDSVSEKDGDTEKDEVVELNRENDEPQNLIRSGKCGESLTWNLDTETGVLSIQGNGDMYDYDGNNNPWKYSEEKIQTVIISDQVTSIGTWAFSNCRNLEQVSLSNNLKQIGEYAFLGCEKLQELKLPESLEIIGGHTFSGCENLKTIKIADNVTSIGDGAFSGCRRLNNIEIPRAYLKTQNP